MIEVSSNSNAERTSDSKELNGLETFQPQELETSAPVDSRALRRLKDQVSKLE
jgi:hypothetical protein